jgi:hypothetical protein
MEQWEHMAVRIRLIEHSGQLEVQTIAAPTYAAQVVDTSDAPETPSVWMLDRLGAEGWELVEATRLDDEATFWLKRRRPEESGGWAEGI